MASRAARWWVLTGLAISLLTVLVMVGVYQAQGDIDLAAAIRDLDPTVLFVAVGLHIAAHAAWALRQWALARGTGWNFTIRRSMQVITAGVFGAAVTPARVGGDGIRLAMLQSDADDAGQPAQVILSDRALDLVFFVGMGIAAAAAVPVLFGEQAVWMRSLAYVGVFFFVVLLVLIIALVSSRTLVRVMLRPGVLVLQRVAPKRAPRWLAAGDRYLDDIRAGLIGLLRERPLWLAMGWVLTIATWVLEFSVIYVVLVGFGVDIPFMHVILAAVLLNVVTTLPLTPGGSGVAEIGALALFSALAPGVTPVFVLVWRAVTYYYDLAVGGFVALRSAAGWLASRDESHSSG